MYNKYPYRTPEQLGTDAREYLREHPGSTVEQIGLGINADPKWIWWGIKYAVDEGLTDDITPVETGHDKPDGKIKTSKGKKNVRLR